MKPEANLNKAILALKRCIVATFDDAKWRELGYLTDSIDLISSHPRLLRSLYWRDDDYDGHVITVLPQIIALGPKNLEVIEDFVGLNEWLLRTDPGLHAELYESAETVSLEHVQAAARALDILELNKHAARIRKGIRDDPEQAIGSAKELLETVLKAVLRYEAATGDEKIPQLLKRAQRELDLDPKSVGDDTPGRDTIRRTLSSLGQIVVGVAEVRNLYGTGHGRHQSRELQIAHARLVVNAAVTLATFLLEVAAEGRPRIGPPGIFD
jgi:hypothetical protein